MESPDNEYLRWKSRATAYKEWKTQHILSKIVKAGEKVDVRDTEYIWCSGVIELKITTLNRLPLLYIHYEGWNRKYDEYIYSNSDRLAPGGTYTSRSDIPHYHMNPYSNVMQASIVEHGAAAPLPLPVALEQQIQANQDMQQVDNIPAVPDDGGQIEHNAVMIEEQGSEQQEQEEDSDSDDNEENAELPQLIE